jgi:SAM-dependent methyltransferase
MAAILESWEANARQWIEVLDAGELESRRLATNGSVVHAITRWRPGLVLDAGCGEGWLCRALRELGIDTVGVDGVPELIHEARMRGEGHYELLTFEELVRQAQWPAAYFDLVVFNFCLYEKELTRNLLQSARRWVFPSGRLVIQTLHPFVALGTGRPYEDGWQVESWAGLPRAFSHPYKWYYRTISSWLDLLAECGWQLVQMEEPLHPKTGRPASLLITAQKAGQGHRH